jgi:transposase
VVQFRKLLRARDLTGFRAWLPQASRSTVPEVCGFARGLRRDRLAALAAFVYAWNNGQVEGHVNRLKMRQAPDVRACQFRSFEATSALPRRLTVALP